MTGPTGRKSFRTGNRVIGHPMAPCVLCAVGSRSLKFSSCVFSKLSCDIDSSFY